MHVFPVIIDSLPPYAQACGAADSVLTLPAGHELLMLRLIAQLRRVAGQRPAVFPDFVPDADYERRLTTACGPLLGAGPGGFEDWLAQREPSDLLLLIDPRILPLGELDLAPLVAVDNDPRISRFRVAIDNCPAGADEWAALDLHGNVARVQRYYDEVTRLATRGVYAAAMPATAFSLRGQRHVEPLARLRAAAVAAGAPTSDAAARQPLANLHQQRGLLDLNEHCLHRLEDRAPPGYVEAGERVWLGRDVRLDPGAVVIGPVLVHAGAQIERDAQVIGPAVIGPRAVVRSSAAVVQAVVAGDAIIDTPRCVRHRVGFSAEPEPEAGEADEPVEPASSAFSSLVVAEAPVGAGPLPPRRPAYRICKRATDVVAAGLGLLALLPFMALVGALVKLTSSGPMLFGHRREGRGGRTFTCYKFRTMEQDAHERQRDLYAQNKIDGPQFMIPDDPRITRVGRVLRSTCIDELPQLWNVLTGDMSLVGPRPSPFRENQICVPWRQARLSVRPGMTGLWQICRSERSLGDFHQWIHYDILYVRNASYWLDLKIIVHTILSLGGRRPVPVTRLLPAEKLCAWSELEAPPAAEPARGAARPRAMEAAAPF